VDLSPLVRIGGLAPTNVGFEKYFFGCGVHVFSGFVPSLHFPTQKAKPSLSQWRFEKTKNEE
jgi:hypothetical protein